MTRSPVYFADLSIKGRKIFARIGGGEARVTWEQLHNRRVHYNEANAGEMQILGWFCLYLA